MDSSTMSSSMTAIFTNSHSIALYSTSWTPKSEEAFAGTCIFLLFLASSLRGLLALRTTLEQRWLDQARKRRYVLVSRQGTEADKIEADPMARNGCLMTARGVEENVRVVDSNRKKVIPFRLSVDVPRAILATITVGVAYLLMLAVMTMSVGYFLSILAGTLLGELAIGRYISSPEH